MAATRRRTLVGGGAALLLSATVLTGCRTIVGVDVSLDRAGKGLVHASARLDSEAQRYLSRDGVDLTSVKSSDGTAIADALFPWATIRDGWTAPKVVGDRLVKNSPLGVARESDGTLVLSTIHPVVSAASLKKIMDTTLSTPPLVNTGDQLTDLPASVPLLNDFTFSLKPDGPNSDFNMFGRAGVGALDAKTCSGDDLATLTVPDAALRRDLSFAYRFIFPEKPRRSSATDIRNNQAKWSFRYGDCPRLSAGSNRGSSSRVLNGAILAGAATFLALILSLRAFRRRRERRSSNTFGQSEG